MGKQPDRLEPIMSIIERADLKTMLSEARALRAGLTADRPDRAAQSRDLARIIRRIKLDIARDREHGRAVLEYSRYCH
jgi:hypothetical protein